MNDVVGVHFGGAVNHLNSLSMFPSAHDTFLFLGHLGVAWKLYFKYILLASLNAVMPLCFSNCGLVDAGASYLP